MRFRLSAPCGKNQKYASRTGRLIIDATLIIFDNGMDRVLVRPDMKALRSVFAVCLYLVASPCLAAQGIVSEPVGYVSTTIAPSKNGKAYATTLVSPTLLHSSSVNGASSGTLSAVAPNAVWVAAAGWTPNQLSSSKAYLLVKSGKLGGLVLRITSNTADRANLDTQGINLLNAGLKQGDSFEFIEGDTLLSMFGTTKEGVIGGSARDFSRNLTDRVSLRDASGVVRTYYFNTTFRQWRRPNSNANQGGVPISPYAGAAYSRIGRDRKSVV
jgi:hypothetical protein